MIVLGIDPGTAATGYGVVSGEPFGSLSLIRTTSRDPLPVRLRELYEDMSALIARHKPQAVSVEDVFYAKNVRTTVVLGHARGVLLLAAEQVDRLHRQPGLHAQERAEAAGPPAEIKKAVVGRGAATKEQVQFMVARLLRLRTPPQPNDAADGTAAALAHIMSARIPRLNNEHGHRS